MYRYFFILYIFRFQSESVKTRMPYNLLGCALRVIERKQQQINYEQRQF